MTLGFKTEWSEKELRLIEFFGYGDIAGSGSCAGPVMYRMMAEKAFLDYMEGKEVESLRRCCRAMNDMSVYRLTKEWDDMIEFSDEKSASVGSSLDDFLMEDGTFDEVHEGAMKHISEKDEREN